MYKFNSGVSKTKKVDYTRIKLAQEINKNSGFYLSMSERFMQGESLHTQVYFAFDLEGIRKDRAYIEAAYLEVLLQQVVDVVKSKTGYREAVVSLGHIDHYTDYTDLYDTPKVVHSKGKRKLVVESEVHGSIPKGWTVDFEILFDGNLSTRARNSILAAVLEVVGLEYNDEVKKTVQKYLKNKDNMSHSYARTYFSYDA